MKRRLHWVPSSIISLVSTLTESLRAVMECWRCAQSEPSGWGINFCGMAQPTYSLALDAAMQSAIRCVPPLLDPLNDVCKACDGTSHSPRAHAPVPSQEQDDWLDKVGPHIQARMERYAASEIRFNLMAVIGDRSAALTGRLQTQQAEYASLQERLAAGPHTGSAPMEVGHSKDAPCVARSAELDGGCGPDSTGERELLSR